MSLFTLFSNKRTLSAIWQIWSTLVHTPEAGDSLTNAPRRHMLFFTETLKKLMPGGWSALLSTFYCFYTVPPFKRRVTHTVALLLDSHSVVILCWNVCVSIGKIVLNGGHARHEYVLFAVGYTLLICRVPCLKNNKYRF